MVKFIRKAKTDVPFEFIAHLICDIVVGTLVQIMELEITLMSGDVDGPDPTANW